MYLDYIYLGIILISLCFGYISGFVKTSLSCIVLILCIYGCQFVIPYTAEASLIVCSDLLLASYCTYILAFIICYLFGLVVIERITKGGQNSENDDDFETNSTQESKPGKLNSILGALLGGIRGVFMPLLVVSVLYILNVPLANYDVTAESVVSQYIYVMIREKKSMVLNSIVSALSPGNRQIREVMKNSKDINSNNYQKGGSRRDSRLDLSSFTN